MKKITLSAAGIILTWTLILVACSAPTAPINVDADGITIEGYDTVAYFTDGKPVKGNKEFQYEWQGAKWLFANEQHLNMFKKSPEKYAPQYGGY
jgi:YHS domain-containing protein